MSKKTVSMLYDDRPIDVVNDERAGHTIASVGSNGVTRIVAYGEPGDSAFKPWIAIYRGDFLAQRVDASGLSIYYRDTGNG